MRRRAKGRWVDAAIDSMRLSSQAAAACLGRHGVRACTDVTGFGLLGHLVEMTRASGVDAVLQIEAVPVLEGAAETVAAGILSSLQPQNLRLRRAVRDLERAAQHPRFPLLFDPQTAGGLLAGVPPRTPPPAWWSCGAWATRRRRSSAGSSRSGDGGGADRDRSVQMTSRRAGLLPSGQNAS